MHALRPCLETYSAEVCGRRCLAPTYTLLRARSSVRPFLGTKAAGKKGRKTPDLPASTERVVPEDYAPWRRLDMSEIHAHEARQGFLDIIEKGEAGIRLADAALQVAAEDDAIISHSTVKLPVKSFQSRIARLAADVANNHIPSKDTASPHQQLQAVKEFLFTRQGFRLPGFGRSNIPEGTVVDHPGVWEDARQAYLSDTLISKRGIAASLGVLFADVMQRLLLSGAVDFAVRMDCSSHTRLPEATILAGMPREGLIGADGAPLNTCTSEALIEMLQFLKRAFWPFPWDTSSSRGSGGGFAGAAQVALEGGSSDAGLEAISRTAKHRLNRGIWTSPGAGDIRRAVPATERLVLLGDAAGVSVHPCERRDLAVLLLHAEMPGRAMVELRAFADSSAAREASAEDRKLVQRLLQKLKDGALDTQSQRLQPLSIASCRAQPTPELQTESRVPLTW
ncbi:hypothetical protein WJX74_008333 [Apatococcus lobatus]|uniref:Uncharacterized protein n=1 Tax=Apatococcus lobatus TaxID=904363 RepID=A0AAW1QZ19_9CHLO